MYHCPSCNHTEFTLTLAASLYYDPFPAEEQLQAERVIFRNAPFRYDDLTFYRLHCRSCHREIPCTIIRKLNGTIETIPKMPASDEETITQFRELHAEHGGMQ